MADISTQVPHDKKGSYIADEQILQRKMWSSYRSSPPEVFLEKRCSENRQQIYRRAPMPNCDFNRAALLLYSSRTSAWVLSCKFAAYFRNIFF